jgi:hypothetical protein
MATRATGNKSDSEKKGYTKRLIDSLKNLKLTNDMSLKQEIRYNNMMRLQNDLQKKDFELRKRTYNINQINNKSLQKIASVSKTVAQANRTVPTSGFNGANANTTLAVANRINALQPPSGGAKNNPNVNLQQYLTRLTTAINNGFKNLNNLGIKAFKLFQIMLMAMVILHALKRIPSALAAAVELLEFGFLFLLKPLADLLATLLMPIAKAVIQLALWVNKLPPFWQKVIGILEGIILGIVGLAGALSGLLGGRIKGIAQNAVTGAFNVGKAIAKRIKGFFNVASALFKKITGIPNFSAWLAQKFPGVVNLGKLISSKITGALNWLEVLKKSIKEAPILDIIKSKIKGTLNWLELVKQYIKGKAISVKEFFEAFLKDEKGTFKLDFLETIVKSLEETLGKVTSAFKGVLEEGALGKIIKQITEWLGEKGFLGLVSKAFTGLGKLMGDGLIGLVAYASSWFFGWIASKLQGTPFEHLFRLLEDLSFAVARVIDPFNWIINIAEDLWNALHGDFSFSNTINEIKGILLDLYNCFVDVYNWFASIANKVSGFTGVTLPIFERVNTQLGRTEEVTKDTAKKGDEANESFWNFAQGAKQVEKSMEEKIAEYKATSMENQRGYEYAVAGIDDRKNKSANVNDNSGWSKTYGKPSTHLAIGGIVTSPTYALIGESGAEAVLPLTKLKDYAQLMNDSITTSSQSHPINVSFNGLVDEHRFRDIIREEAGKIFNSHRRINGSNW